jgi:NAD(P)-dependent dehydrogenase (short-subunit alcohol dehydrogenase family)
MTGLNTSRVVVVAGAAGGMGSAIAERFRRDGARVVGLDRRPGQGRTVDLSDVAAIHEIAESINDELGRIDVWVNAAGVLKRSPAIDLSPAEWAMTLSVNLDATFFGAQAAARVMRRTGGGVIVNVSSYAAFRPRPGSVDYAVSKAAVSHLTACLAAEWADYRIRVNAVAPGYVDTPMTAWMEHENVREQMLERVPVKSFARPEEIADAVAYLSGDGARYITGISMPIDGGISLT